MPGDAHRDVPDVALTSSTHDGYLVAMNGELYVIGGTSAATPSLGGLMVLVGQKSGGRLGNANPALYALAAKQSSGGAPVFHDITSGNNTVPGVTGYSAAAGYDLATGLGSVDASLLVNHWNDVSVPTPALQLNESAASLSFLQGSSSTVTLDVAVSGGFNAVVSLSANTLTAGLTASFAPASLAAPGSGAATLKVSAASGMAPGSYDLLITATGGGVSQTAPLTVTILQNCTYSINPSSASLSAAAGSYSFAVTTQSGCTWAAATTTNWIALAGGTPGNGSGKVTYSVALNNSGSTRTAAISAGGLAFTVTQAAASAVFVLNPTSANFPVTGGTGSIAIAATPSSASWIAFSNASWISITGATSGTGSKMVTYTVSSNSSGGARSASLTIAGLTFAVSQAGATSCSYQISLSPITSGLKGFVGSVSVTTSAGCQWTAASNASWLAITSGSSGSGSGTVSYLAAPNTATSSRNAVLTVAGFTIDLTEASASRTAIVIL